MFRNLYNVISRETRTIFKYPIYLMCMVVMPCLCTLFFTSLMENGQPVDMPVGVVDNDNTTTTRKLTACSTHSSRRRWWPTTLPWMMHAMPYRLARYTVSCISQSIQPTISLLPDSLRYPSTTATRQSWQAPLSSRI